MLNNVVKFEVYRREGNKYIRWFQHRADAEHWCKRNALSSEETWEQDYLVVEKTDLSEDQISAILNKSI